MTPIKLNVTLRQLRGLEALHEHASFSVASEKLAMTQGALSRLIQELEAQIGFKLFNRTTRRIELTAEGGRYLAQAKKVLAEVRKLDTVATRLGSDERDEVRVGSTANLIASELPNVLQRFRLAHPRVPIQLTDLHPDDLVEAVKKGHVDLAVGPRRMWSQEEITAVPLFESKLHFVVGPRHRFAKMKMLTWADVMGEVFILNSQASIHQLEIQSGISLASAKLLKLSHLQSMLSLVESGAGITIIYAYAKKHIATYNVIAIEAIEPHVFTTVCVFQRTGATLEAPAQRFFDFVAKSRFQGEG